MTSEACGQGADSADPPLPDRLDAARAAWAGALAVNPWLELDGLALRGLTIEQQHGRFRVRALWLTDADGRTLAGAGGDDT